MPLAETLLTKFVELVFDLLVKQTGIETRVRDWLGLDPARLAFKRAFTRAYTAFARQYPELTAALFDETFLTGSAAPELAKLLQRDPARPDAVLLVRLWKEALGTRLPLEKDAQLVSAVAAWVRWLEAELKSEAALRPVFDSRALETLPKLEEKLDRLCQELERGLALALDKASRYQNVTVGGHYVVGNNNIVTSVYNTYFTAGYTTLDDFYIRPDAVFQRVRIENFTGREWLEAEVTQFLEQNRSGVFLLVGDAGVGKTAFMAHLVAKYRFLHLFGEQVRGESNVTRAIESLGVQLVTRYQIQNYTDRNSLPQIAGFPDFLDRLLQTASQERCQGEKIVIVCDALDEAGSGSNGNVLGLPAVLPDGVFLLLSQRPVDVPLHIDVTPHIVKLDAASKENQEDLLAFLNAMAHKPAIADHLRARKYSTEEFVTRLAQKSEGIMMYVNYILREIEDGSRYPLDLEQLPVGLVDYYTRYWSNWKAAKNGDSPDWEKICAPLLGILAAAEEPAGAEQLAGWGGIDAWEVEKLLTGPWRAFMTCQPAKDGTELFTIYHTSLRDFLRGQADHPALTPQQQSILREFKRRSAQAHAKIVAYYRAACEGDWVRLVEDDYPRQHLSTHFIGAGQAGVLYALLVQSDAWAKARFHQEGHYDGYRVDLDLLWETLRQQKNLPQIIRTALCKASIVSTGGFIETSLLVQAVKQQVLPVAVAFIYLRQNPDLFTQITAQAAIFASLSRAQQDQFRLLIHECLDHTTRLQNEQMRAIVLGELAPHLSDQLLAQALQTAQAFGDEYYRAKALVTLAPYLPIDQQPSVLAQTLQTAQNIQDEYHRSLALTQLAPLLPDDQRPIMLAQALQAALTIHDEQYRVIALRGLAPHLSGPELAQALQAALTIHDKSQRALALEGLAPHLPSLLLAQALQAALVTDDEYSRAKVLGILTPYLPNDQQPVVLAQALQAAQTIQDEYHRALALGRLAPHLPNDQQQGTLARAFQIALGIQSIHDRSLALSELAQHLSDQQLAQALHAAQTIQKESYRANALVWLAPYLPNSLLAQALQTAYNIQNESDLARTLGKLSLYLPDDQQPVVLAKALQVAQTIRDEYHRALALNRLAPYLPDQLLAEILQTTLTIQDESDRVAALAQLVPHLPNDQQEGLLAQAVQIAQDIQDDYDRAKALAALTPRLPEDQKVDVLNQALQAAQAIQEEFNRTLILNWLVPYLPDPLLAQALQIAKNFQSEYNREWALEIIAPCLPETLLSQALQIAQSFQDESNRALTLGRIARYLPEDQKPVLLAQALETAKNIQKESDRANALVRLAPDLPDPLLAKALQAAQTIQDESTHLMALARFISHLPEAQKPVVLAQALQVARTIQDGSARANTLAELIPHLPEDQKLDVLAQALQAAQSFQHGIEQQETIRKLILACPDARLFNSFSIVLRLGLESSEVFEEFTRRWDVLIQSADRDEFSLYAEILRTYAAKQRRVLLEILGATQPIILRIGGQAAIQETAQAILDVGQWWP